MHGNQGTLYKPPFLQVVCTGMRQLDRSPAFLTSDDFVRSHEIVRTKWSIYEVIGHFVLMI